MTSLQILVVDQLEIVRKKIRGLVESAGWQVCGEPEGEFEVLDAIDRCQPDLVIFDISGPLFNATHTIRQITEGHPKIRVLATSVYVTAEVSLQVKAAGAHGIVQKVDLSELLKDAVDAFTKGEDFFPIAAPQSTRRAT